MTLIEQAVGYPRTRRQFKGAAANDAEDGATRTQAESWRQRAAEAEAEADVWRVQCARLQVRVAARLSRREKAKGCWASNAERLLRERKHAG